LEAIFAIRQYDRNFQEKVLIELGINECVKEVSKREWLEEIKGTNPLVRWQSRQCIGGKELFEVGVVACCSITWLYYYCRKREGRAGDHM
jgi:hypothetical protein